MSDDAMEMWRTRLRCDYFARVVRRVLSSKFAEYEYFEDSSAFDSDRVTFCGPTAYVDVSYESEPLPPHRPTVFLGKGRRLADGGVPAWFLIPEMASARNYWQWTFADEDRLELVLEKLWDNVIFPFAMPIVTDQSALSDVIVRFARYADTIR